jgi:hypothetical protein
MSAEAPKSDHLAVVIEGVQKFPRDLGLLMQATLLAARRGFPKEAKLLAEHGVKVAKDPAQKERFEMVVATFAPETAPASPATATTPASAAASESYLLEKIP